LSDSKNTLIKHAKINWSDQSEPFSTQFADVYFNTEQGLNESLYVFLQGNRLQQRWPEFSEPVFAIAETGFGTGLNFLMTCLAFQRFQNSNPSARLQRLHFSSFEKYPLNKEDLQKALQRWPSLTDFIDPLIEQYPLGLNGCHRIMLDKYNITLDLWFGDVLDCLPSLYNYQSGLFDCWYLDGFAPSKNPDMWNAQLFEKIAETCKIGATIATFSAAGFVRRALIAAGFTMQKRKGYGKKREMLVGQIARTDSPIKTHGQHYRNSASSKNNEVAIIGGGISSACLSLALVKRGYKVTLYCKDSSLAQGASGNQQGALYPLLNAQHDSLSQLFANSFLFTRNYVQQIQQTSPFDCDLSGLLQLYYDHSAANKLEKILDAQLPNGLVHKCTTEQTEHIANLAIGVPSLFYPLGGWLSQQQMVESIFRQAQMRGDLTVHFNQQLRAFSEQDLSWDLHFADKVVNHELLVLTTAFNTLDFTQCAALPLSAARGQVSHIPTTEHLRDLQVTLCHEGYLTPVNKQQHCMGATFIRHQTDLQFSQQEQTENKSKLAKCINKQWVDKIDIDHQDANVAIRCTTRDHFPYVGAIPDYPASKVFYKDVQKTLPADNAPFHKNLYMLTGLGSRGLCTAPLLAEMLAAQICREPLPFSKDILEKMQGNRQWINYLKKGKPLSL